MTMREPGWVWRRRHVLPALMAAGSLAASACGWAAEREGWDALVEEAHKLLTDQSVRAKFRRRHRVEALDATCAILRYARSPEDSLREARALSEPFFASLALGGIAALTIKSAPETSEKLLEEAQQVARKINRWIEADATSLGYLIQLIRHYEPERARRILASFRKTVDSRSECSRGQAIHQLALATIEVNPGAAKGLLVDSALKSGDNLRSIEVLVQFLMKQSPDDTLKLAQEHYDAKRPTCADFLRLVLAEHALRDPKDAFERARKMRPENRGVACYSITMALLAAGKKEQAKPMADFLDALEESRDSENWFAQDRLRQVREA
ncbi:MAG: hypothetical protein FJ291_30330, partial [Planctomycetes bacterium]|nr:hypothetical protein [Planctomycetota bacterium]